MKRIVILSAMTLLGGSFLFTSCSKKKDWTCRCTVNGSATNPTAPIMDAKESDAQKACDLLESQSNSAFPNSTDCILEEN